MVDPKVNSSQPRTTASLHASLHSCRERLAVPNLNQRSRQAWNHWSSNTTLHLFQRLRSNQMLCLSSLESLCCLRRVYTQKKILKKKIAHVQDHFLVKVTVIYIVLVWILRFTVDAQENLLALEYQTSLSSWWLCLMISDSCSLG